MFKKVFTQFKLIILSVICLSSIQAVAQDGDGVAPPPLHEVVDSQGFDWANSSPNTPGMFVSIGTKESGLVRDPGREWSESDNFTGTITEVILKTSAKGLTAGIVYTRINIEGHSEFFQLSGGTYVNVENTQGTFNCVSTICTYLPKGGAVYEFDATIKSGFYYSAPSGITDGNVLSEMFYQSQKNRGSITKITRPDGEIIQVAYVPYLTSTRTIVSSVSSSLGWMIKYQYGNFVSAGSKFSGERSITAINSSMEYCDPGVTPCDNLAYPWPKSRMTHEATTDVVSSSFQTIDPHSRTAYSPRSSSWALDVYTIPNSYWLTSLRSSVFNALNKETKYSTSNNEVPGSSGREVNYKTPGGVYYSYSVPGCTMNYGNGICYNEPYTGKINKMTVGSTHTFNYGYQWVSGSKKTVTGPDGTLVSWWPTSKPVSFTDKLGRKTSYTYADTYGNYADKIIDPDATPSLMAATGGLADYDYDLRGNITNVTVYPKNGTATPLVTAATYPHTGSTTCSNPKTCNKPLTITDQNGVITTYDYYPEHGGIKTVTKPAVNGIQAQTLYMYEQKTPYVKNSSGSLIASAPVWRLVSTSQCMTQTLNTCAGTADELRTEYSDFNYNLLSKKTTIKHGDGSVVLITTRDYDIYGNLSWENGPRPGDYDAVYYFYDALRQKIGEISTDPDGSGPLPRQAVRIGYNNDGKVSSVEKGIVLGTDRASLDAITVKVQNTTEYSPSHGLPIFERLYAGGVLKKLTQKGYDSNLRLDCVAQRLSFSTSLDACSLGQATEVYSNTSVTVNDRITKYAYDSTGAMTSTTSAYGTSLARKDRGNTYDPANGLLQIEADGVGNITTYTYDDFKRLSKTIYPLATNGTAKNDNDYTQKFYTKNYVSSIRLRDAQTITFNPDAVGRVGSKTGAVSETFTYNNFDQISSHINNITGGASATSTYKRKAIGWIEYEESTIGKVSYDYDSFGRRTKLTWPDNVYVNYDYDVNGYAGDYLKKITESSGNLLASFDYYDTGKRKTLTRGNGVVTSYSYDSMQRLENYSTDVGGEATVDDIAESFTYTLVGQVKSRAMNVVNSGYIYTPSVSTSTSYVPNGLNQIASSNGIAFGYDLRGNLTTDNASTSYTYNANNLLLSTTNSGVTTTLSYDAENRLFSVVKGGVTTKLQYDGSDLIAETGASNNILRRYVHGPETDDPIVWYEGSGLVDKRYYTIDRQGSVVGTTGASPAFNAYDEYGIQKNSSIGRFQYTGQTWLPEVGLYYYKARFYNPNLGRFMQADPIGYKDGMNWYAYTGNDPVNYIDPTGESKYNRNDHSGLAMAGLIAKGVAAFTEPGSSANKTANEVDRVTARAMEAYADDGKAAKGLPKMKGMGSNKREATLTEAGFEKTKVSNSPAKNETWKHDDGSEVRVHPYGNEKTSEHKSGNNAHLHKQDTKGNQLDDRGNISDDPNKTHIGLPNPPNLPDIRDRKHGV